MVYTIVEIGWEYNDQNYYLPESGGGRPKVAYRNRLKAEAECLKLNLEIYRKHSNILSSYISEDGPNPDDLLIIAHLGVTANDGGIQIPIDISDEDLTQVITALGVVFYEITLIELADDYQDK